LSGKYKYMILLGDGMSDRPLVELGGRTPLEEAKTPNMDSIASRGVIGLVRTIPEGMVKGSDIANLSVLGYDPASIYTGRSPLEAAGMGVEMGPDDVAFRCNLVTLGVAGPNGVVTDLPPGELDPGWLMVDFAGGHPTAEEAERVVDSLAAGLKEEGVELHLGVSYRHLLVWREGIDKLEVEPPHDLTDRPVGDGWPKGPAADKVLGIISRSMGILSDHPVNRERLKGGKSPVNSVWLWGQGRRPALPAFFNRYGLKGAMITAVDLLRGIGVSLGFKVINVPGATGYLDTNYEGKAQYALDALGDVDLVYVHVEAPDEASHGGSLTDKIRAIEDFDAKVVGPVLEGLESAGPCRVMVLPDHATPLAMKTHSGDPVPFAAMDSRSSGSGSGLGYSEKSALGTGLKMENGHELMGRFINWDLDDFAKSHQRTR